MKNRVKAIIVTFSVMFLTANMWAQNRNEVNQLFYQDFLPEVRSDSLIVERSNGLKVKLVWPYRKNLKKQIKWEVLLTEFQDNFKKVLADIPEYEFYSIDYSKNKELVVSEVSGINIYTVKNNDQLKYVKSNICKISGDDFIMYIEFSQKEELLDPSLLADVAEAASQVNHIFYVSSVSKDRYFYSIEKAKMLPPPKNKTVFFSALGARAGFRQNSPYVELRPGLGVHSQRENYFSLNTDFLISYDELTERSQSDVYLSLNYASLGPGLGASVGYRVSNGIDGSDGLDWRVGLKYKTNAISMGVDYYPSGGNPERNIIWGFNIGFGF